MSWLIPQAHGSTFTPPTGTEIAQHFDYLYGFLLIACFVSSALVIGGIIYFAIKYKRQSEDDKTPYISHNNVLEFLWSFIPFLIFMVVFGWGWILFHEMRNAPEDSFEVNVQARMYGWDFLYKSGRKSPGQLYVPVNRPVKLIMSSDDVLHSFFIPAFRIKQDVIPGRYTTIWFNAEKKGSYQVFCTEYCGTGHSGMLATVNVLDEKEWEDWMANDPYKGLELAEIGAKVFQGRCTACHYPTSEKLVGPGLAKLFGKERAFVKASSAVADENYIRESILYPQQKVVAGYEGINMQSFQGLLDEQELLGLIEYIKSLQ